MQYQYKREPLASDDANKLVNACNTLKEKLIIFTLLDTGMRVSELESLNKKDIQWQERTFYIYGKKSKRRILPMTERVYIAMQSWFTIQDKIGMCKRTIQFIVKRIAKRAGIIKPVSCHILRHTFAVSCIKKGIPTRALQNFLGHDHLATTEIYLNLTNEDVIRIFREKFI